MESAHGKCTRAAGTEETPEQTQECPMNVLATMNTYVPFITNGYYFILLSIIVPFLLLKQLYALFLLAFLFCILILNKQYTESTSDK